MVRMTMIARLSDGLILVASGQDQDDSELMEYQDVAKKLFKRLNEQSESRCSLVAGAFMFHYLIEHGVIYTALCEPSYPRALAFSYLEEVHKEFQQQYDDDEIAQASRPYQFMKFDTFMERLKKQYRDTRAQKNLNRLNEELREVSSIMTKNIEQVLRRGEELDKMSAMSEQLFGHSKKYFSHTRKLNLQFLYRKYGPILIVSLIVLVLLYIRFKWF